MLMLYFPQKIKKFYRQIINIRIIFFCCKSWKSFGISFTSLAICNKQIINKKHLIFKDNKLIILQSEKMLEILDSFPEEIFIDSTFKIIPEPLYQLLILRVFDQKFWLQISIAK